MSWTKNIFRSSASLLMAGHDANRKHELLVNLAAARGSLTFGRKRKSAGRTTSGDDMSKFERGT